MTAWVQPISLPPNFLCKLTILCGVIFLFIQADPVEALCLSPPGTRLSALADLASKNPQAALAELKAEISQAKTKGSPAQTVAWLHAIEGDAYWQLSDSAAGEKAARSGMALPIHQSDPAYVQLLIQYVFRDFRTETFRASMPVLTAARAKFRPGSDEDICLQATIGDVQRIYGDFAASATNLVSAYRASQTLGRQRQQIYAGYALALFMRSAGDYEKALQLISERAAWHRKMGYDFMQAADYFIAGRILLRAERYLEALEKIDLAIEAATRFEDERGIAYYRLQRCAALTGVGRISEAREVCDQVNSLFRSVDPDMTSEVEVLLADIAFRDHNPIKALSLLDSALSPGMAKSWSFPESDAYHLRARVHAALGQNKAAYKDLSEFVRLNAVEIKNERARQLISREAEIEADRQILRNRKLKEELEEGQIRSHNQMKQASLLLLAAIVVIIFLIAMTFMAKRNRDLLELSAYVDSLTGLWNRRRLVERGQSMLLDSVRTQQPLSVAIIDIDHFKHVNDTFGHAVGDEVLKCLAEVMKNDIRNDDILGRWGGEEFLLLMPNTPTLAAWEVLERIRNNALEIKLPNTEEICVSFSAGISGAYEFDQTIDTIVNRADIALYKAKKDGRGRSLCWNNKMVQYDEQSTARK